MSPPCGLFLFFWLTASSSLEHNNVVINGKHQTDTLSQVQLPKQVHLSKIKLTAEGTEMHRDIKRQLPPNIQNSNHIWQIAHAARCEHCILEALKGSGRWLMVLTTSFIRRQLCTLSLWNLTLAEFLENDKHTQDPMWPLCGTCPVPGVYHSKLFWCCLTCTRQ